LWKGNCGFVPVTVTIRMVMRPVAECEQVPPPGIWRSPPTVNRIVVTSKECRSVAEALSGIDAGRRRCCRRSEEQFGSLRGLGSCDVSRAINTLVSVMIMKAPALEEERHTSQGAEPQKGKTCRGARFRPAVPRGGDDRTDRRATRCGRHGNAKAGLRWSIATGELVTRRASLIRVIGGPRRIRMLSGSEHFQSHHSG